MREALPLIVKRGARVISNAGGVNPLGCRGALLEMAQREGHAIEVAAVVGDDLMDRLGELNAAGVTLDNMEDGAPFASIRERVSSANVYYGAWPVVEALRGGAQVVVTGRCTDTGITLAPMIHAFGWEPGDWDRLASGIVAGHIVECGAQSTGGNFTDWRRVKRFESIGYPIVEVSPDGSFVVTKHAGTGGVGTVRTVKEQLVDEMGEPRSYITPDVVADFATIRLEQAGRDRVRVWGVKGRAAPSTLKVSASYFDGLKASGSLVISAPDASGWRDAFADLFGSAWARRSKPHTPSGSDTPRAGARRRRRWIRTDLPPVGARSDKDKIEKFAKRLPAVILSGPPGVAGTGGRPQSQEVVAYWPALVPRDRVKPTLVSRSEERELDWPTPIVAATKPAALGKVAWPKAKGSSKLVTVPLSALAHGRSGDKGDTCNVGVIARSAEIYPWLARTLAAALVKRRFKGITLGRVKRHEVPNLWALNFLLHESLGGGGTVSLRLDAQGKRLSHALLAMPVRAPKALVEAARRGDAADGVVAVVKTGTKAIARPKRTAHGARPRTKR